MNKKLLALAVAGVVAAPVAQAQTANVTLYGRLNLDLEVVSAKYQVNGGTGVAGCPTAGTVCTTDPNLYRVSNNSSRFGMRGTEALGGGLNAIFQLESSAIGDAGGGTIAGRDTFIGLQGSWGTVKIGNFLAPYDDMHPIFGNAPTLATTILSTASLWAQGFASKATGGFDARLGNSIRYDMPNIQGFTAGVQYSTAEGAPTNNSGVWSLAGQYAAGPLQVGIGYEYNHRVRSACATVGGQVTCPSDDAFTFAIAYNFGVVRPAFVWERLDYDVVASTGTTSLTRDLYGVTFTVPLGAGIAYASWIRANDGKGSAPTGSRVAGLVKGNETGSDQWSISYSYPLSKRTLTYIGYVQNVNDAYARYNFNINPVQVTSPAGGTLALPSDSSLSCNATPTGAGSNLECGKPSGFIMGVVHFF